MCDLVFFFKKNIYPDESDCVPLWVLFGTAGLGSSETIGIPIGFYSMKGHDISME